MKQTLNISAVYIGLVIGAGFASGREIFEYFNLSSRFNLSGIILATVCFSLLSYIILSLSKKLGLLSFDNFLQEVSPRFSPFFKIFMSLFMFCGYFVMLSASGTLFEETLSLPFEWGVFCLSLICFLVFIFDISGIITVNIIMVPVMILGMSLLCIFSTFVGLPAFLNLTSLKSNPIISALCYVSYNTITAGAVLVPLAKNATSHSLKRAAILSGILLGSLIFSVWFTLNIYYDQVFSSEMPLLELAAFHGDLYKGFYAIILFMALCTTAISHGFGLLSKFHFPKRLDKILASALFCLIAMPFAKLGFSTLISKLYAVFGFLGLLWTGVVVFKYLKTN